MIFVRHTLPFRLVAALLLGGFGLWVAAPLAVAYPHAAAAQMARAHAVGPVEAAVAEALAAAASAPDDPEAFEHALLAALEAHPEGVALAEYLAGTGAPVALLDLLLGELLRNRGLPAPHLVAAVAAPSAPTGASGDRALATVLPHAEQASVGTVSAPVAVGDVAVVSVRELSAAQPLGP
jgi:hypothetical protein